MKRIYKRKSEPKQAETKVEEYKPTPFEAEALAAYKDASSRRGPRLKFKTDGANAVKIAVDHPEPGVGQFALMRAIGTMNVEFYSGLLGQLVNASKGKAPSEASANFMLAVVKGIEPGDQIEAMLAAQMAAVHMASMTFALRLAHVDNIPQQDSAERAFNKLTRTFAAQVAALKDYRSKGEQKMTVQHVHVAEGGQAIVGNVSGKAAGGGASGKDGEQPHAKQISDARSVALLCDLEAERESMPSASGARL